MSGLRARWTAFWFEPASQTNLALCRIFFYGALFLFYPGEDRSAWGDVSDAFWMPIWLFRTLHPPQLSVGHLASLQVIWKAALALTCIGLVTRASSAVSVVLGAYLLGLPHNFWTTHHRDAVVVLIPGSVVRAVPHLSCLLGAVGHSTLPSGALAGQRQTRPHHGGAGLRAADGR